MTVHFDAGWTDDELDSFLRAEMAVLRDSAPAPALRPAAPRARWRVRLPWSAPPDRPHRLASLAAALALAAVVAAGGGTWLTTHRERGSGASGPVGAPSAHPTAPAPASPTVTSTVRTGVPLIYYRASKPGSPGPMTLVAVDWSGDQHGRITLSHDAAVVQSPDGATLLVGSDVYSSAGALVGRVASVPQGEWLAWADDGSRFCNLQSAMTQAASGPVLHTWLNDLDLDGGRRTVVELPALQGDQSSWTGLSCSGRKNRATVLAAGQDGVPVTLLTVSLSTGATLSRHDFHENVGMVDPISADGKYLGTLRSTESGSQPGVYELLTGRFTAKLPTSCLPQAFTADESDILCASQPDAMPRTVSLVNWRTGSVDWRVIGYAGGPNDLLVQPGGTRIALAWSGTNPGTGPPDAVPMTIAIIDTNPSARGVEGVASNSGGLVGLY